MTEQTPEQKQRDNALRQAYGAATKRLREAHLDEFNAYRKEEAAKAGIDWEPRPTAEDKAAAELQTLLSSHPALAERLAQEVLAKYQQAPVTGEEMGG